METSSNYEEDIFDMLSVDTPLLTPPPATPASGTPERQITTPVPYTHLTLPTKRKA